MATEQVRIDLVANDEASPVIHDVADEVRKLEATDAQVEVTADAGKARQTIDELISNVSKLDNESATVVLAIRAAQVQRELTDVLTDVEQLDALDPTIDVKLANAQALAADLDKLSTEIKSINDTPLEIDTTGATDGFRKVAEGADGAQRATHSFVGNAVSELPGVQSAFGPLGEAVGQMTEGLLAGEIAMSGLIAAALPIAGVAVAVKLITAAFAANKKRAEEARKRVDDYTQALIKAGEEGTDALAAIEDTALAAAKGNDKLIHSAAVLGLTWDDVAAAIKRGEVSDELQHVIDIANQFDVVSELASPEQTALWDQFGASVGLSGEALAGLGPIAHKVTGFITEQGGALDKSNDKLNDYNRFFPKATTNTKGLGTAMEDTAENVDHATDALDGINEGLDRLADKIDMEDDVAALGGALVEAMRASSDGVAETVADVKGLRDLVLQVGRDFHRSPVEVETLLEAIERGDFQTVWDTVQGWMRAQPLHQPVELDVSNPSDIRDFLSGQGLTVSPGSFPTAPTAPVQVVNVTQLFPRGFRAASVVAEAQRAARRNGGLYRRAVR